MKLTINILGDSREEILQYLQEIQESISQGEMSEGVEHQDGTGYEFTLEKSNENG